MSWETDEIERLVAKLPAALGDAAALRDELAAANKRSNTHYDLLVIALRQRDAALANVAKMREALGKARKVLDAVGDGHVLNTDVVVAEIEAIEAVLRETE